MLTVRWESLSCRRKMFCLTLCHQNPRRSHHHISCIKKQYSIPLQRLSFIRIFYIICYFARQESVLATRTWCTLNHWERTLGAVQSIAREKKRVVSSPRVLMSCLVSQCRRKYVADEHSHGASSCTGYHCAGMSTRI